MSHARFCQSQRSPPSSETRPVGVSPLPPSLFSAPTAVRALPSSRCQPSVYHLDAHVLLVGDGDERPPPAPLPAPATSAGDPRSVAWTRTRGYRGPRWVRLVVLCNWFACVNSGCWILACQNHQFGPPSLRPSPPRRCPGQRLRFSRGPFASRFRGRSSLAALPALNTRRGRLEFPPTCSPVTALAAPSASPGPLHLRSRRTAAAPPHRRDSTPGCPVYMPGRRLG